MAVGRRLPRFEVLPADPFQDLGAVDADLARGLDPETHAAVLGDRDDGHHDVVTDDDLLPDLPGQCQHAIPPSPASSAGRDGSNGVRTRQPTSISLAAGTN